MRRKYMLMSNFYKRNYKEIYKILFNADIDEINDHSNWYKQDKDYVDIKRPLWIIVESKILNKRIWISHDFGRLGIDTAQLDLDIDSMEYHESYEWRDFRNQKEMTEYLEKLLKPCLEEYKEEIKFNENIKIWKEGIQFAKERIKGFYNKEMISEDVKYITLKTVGEKYSKKIANIMFELGYGEWIFNDSGTLEDMQQQMIDILEDDKDLNEILEEKNLTREQLYRKIKKDFLEIELTGYLQDNHIDIAAIPEEIKKQMINEVKKGMLDNYSYKFIIWDSGNLEGLVEILPDKCFINENIENRLDWEDREEEEL